MRTEHAPQGKPLEEFLLAATLLTAIAAVWALPGCETAKPAPATAPATTAIRPAQQNPLVPSEPTQEEAARIDAALAVAEVGDYEQALASFRELLSDNPTLTDAHLGMASVLERSGDLDKAERSFARAATLERDNFDAQSGHGRVLMALDRYNEAVRAWHKALVVRPESVEANVGMAMAFLGLDQPQTALSFAERARGLARISSSTGGKGRWLTIWKLGAAARTCGGRWPEPAGSPARGLLEEALHDAILQRMEGDDDEAAA